MGTDIKFDMRRLMLAGFAAGVACSVQAAVPALEVISPWSRPAAAGTTGAGFMTLVNRGSVADALIGVESPAARKVEIHRSSSAGGVMSMQMEANVTIPPGRSVRFEPGGLHLMLVGLAKPLKAGDKVPATLVFARGARLRTEFVVGVAAPQAMDGMPGH